MTREENWNRNFELLKAYIEEHHHLPDKKKVENRGLLSWAKYQRKRIKAGALDEEKQKMFQKLMDSRSTVFFPQKFPSSNLSDMTDS